MVMLCTHSAIAVTTVTFTSSDFNGQGTSGTGSAVSATKNGVTFSCDKGFGDQYGVRCYKNANVTISSSSHQITNISFEFITLNDIYYNGNLSENVAVNGYQWHSTMTSQARMNTITVYLNDGNSQPTKASSDSEGFKYINEFTYASDLISSNGKGGFSSTQNPSLGMLKANVFCVEKFYGLSEGQSYADFDVYKNTSLKQIGQFNFCWDWYKVSLGEGSSKSFDFKYAYNNMNIGDTKVITSDEGTVYTFKLIDKIQSTTDSKKKIVFSVDRPLYFGGSENGSVGLSNFRNRVQIKYVSDNNSSFSGPTDISQYTDNGIVKVFSNDNNINIPMTYLAFEKNSCGWPMNCIVIQSPSGLESILYSPDLYSTTSDEAFIPYLYELNGYIYIDLQRKEAGTWHLMLVQEYAGNWQYYNGSGQSTPKYTITTSSANPSWGSASGNTTVDYLTQVTISASANPGYHFTKWNDANTQNPRTITVTKDATYTASFAKNNYTISTTSSNPSWGNATGGKTAAYLDQITITANANSGYYFTKWNDGNTQNPRTITVTKDATYTATFAKNNYIVTTTSSNPSWGNATGGKTAAYSDQITITANANYGYHFTKWNDGNTQNPRTITVTKDATYTASFAKNNYTISTSSSNPSRGSVTGGKTAAYLDQITITANANYGYHFTKWNDGNTQNPRTITVKENVCYTASFDINIYTINVISENNQVGMVMGSGKYEAFTEVDVIAAACQEGYKWSHWSDGVQLAGRKVTLTSDTTLVAYFTNAEESCVEVDVNDRSLGQADLLVMATPNAGTRFVEWSDGEKSNPRVVTYLEPVKYIAIFKEESNPSSVTQLPTSQKDRTRKIIRENHVYILRGDKTYTLTGQEVK